MKALFFSLIILLVVVSKSDGQWQQLSGVDIGTVTSFTTLGETFFATTRNNRQSNIGGMGVVRSTDNGESWSSVTSEAFLKETAAVGVIADSVFALPLTGGKLYKSSDAGATWSQSKSGVPEYLSTLVSIGNVYLGAGNTVAIKRSTDNGSSWTKSTTGFPSNHAECLATNGRIVFAGETTIGNGLYFSLDSGASWHHSKNIGLTDPKIGAIGAFDSVILASTPDGVFRSVDTGDTWTEVQAGSSLGSFASANHIYFASGYDGLKFSTDAGISWNFEEGAWPKNSSVPGLFIYGEYIYAGVEGNGIWRRKTSEFSAVKDHTALQAPVLENYPNPFVSTTTITFSLMNASNVTLTITDPLGKEIIILPPTYYGAGVQHIQWDGSRCPNGIYSCRIVTESKSEIRKMVVVK